LSLGRDRSRQEGGREGGRSKYLLHRGSGVTEGVDELQDNVRELLGDVLAAGTTGSGHHHPQKAYRPFLHLGRE